MGIENFSEDIILVTLPEKPQLSDELKTINEIASSKCDCDVVIDFTRAKILTSSSICNLIILNKLLTGRGRRLILCKASFLIKGIFVVAGLRTFFEFADDKHTALASLQPVKKQEPTGCTS